MKWYKSNRASLAEQTAPRLMPYVPSPNEEDRVITGATLNAQKCEFGKTSITFLGHKIDHKGIQADPDKTRAIRDMKAPTTISELRRFLGMVNQLGKFTPHLAHLTATERTPQQRHSLDVGPRPERCIHSSEGGTLQTYDSSPL